MAVASSRCNGWPISYTCGSEPLIDTYGQNTMSQNRPTRLLLAAGMTIAQLSLSPMAGAGSLQDGDFSNRMFDATGTTTVSREAANGKPGARLDITTVSGSFVYGTAMLTNKVIPSPLQGGGSSCPWISSPVQVLLARGKAIQLLVEQQGSLYGSSLHTTGLSTSWNVFSKSGTFNETPFARLIGSGPANPDFSGNTPTRFGFAAGNLGSGKLTQYYDNFSLESPAITPVSEPQTYAMMLAGMELVGFTARRRSA